MKEPKTFWLEDWEGTAKGGLYFRCDLFKWVKKAEDNGLKVVGIEVEEGSWNLGLITKEGSNELVERKK
mgnify:CR=1 FL=1